MTIIIGGDVVPTKENEILFETNAIKSLIGSQLLEVWEQSDFRLFNLETPLSYKGKPIDKNGPNLVAKPGTIKGIVGLNPSLVLLANNHIMDYGITGYQETVHLLDSSGIKHIGTGESIDTLSKHHIFEKDGQKIGVYNCAEHEFTIATSQNPGANPFNPLTTFEDIYTLKKEVDKIIVIYHGGKEHYRYPSPQLQDSLRKMIDCGADFVVAQHSHCIGSKEVYKDKTIVYGQGNFIFLGEENEFWNSGLLINLTILDDIEIEYIPYITTEVGIRLANDYEKKDIIDAFNSRSLELVKENFVKEEFKRFSQQHINNYLRSLSGQGKWMSRIDRKLFKGRLLMRKFTKKKLLRILNFVECEAHRELLIEGLKEKIKHTK